MVVAKQDLKISIKVDNKDVKQVETFKYLGVRINNDRQHEAEINESWVLTKQIKSKIQILEMGY